MNLAHGGRTAHALVPCDDLGAPGDVDVPGDLDDTQRP